MVLLKFPYQRILLSIVFLLIINGVMAQATKVRGRIVEAETLEPIPFVNVSYIGTGIGTVTDFNGDYFLETKTPGDTLAFSCVGYKVVKYAVNKKAFQTFNIEMQPSNVELAEIVVLPGENPAHILLRKIIANKEKNNPEKIETYQCEVYNKIEFDVNNVDEEFKQQRALKQFQFIFDYLDTSVVSGKTYLPIFFTETLSDYYYRKKPKGTREIIKASKVSGVESQSVSQFTGQMYLDVNLYDNYLEILDQPFVSPIANFGRMYYKYYLIDSMVIDNHWCYNMSFQPKRKQEFTFTGDIWVADTSFAVVRSKIRMAKDANFNFVNDFVIENNFEKIDTFWFRSQTKLMVDFNLTDRSTGFFGRKTSSYRNVLIDSLTNPNIFDTKMNLSFTEDAFKKDKEFWRTARHDSLTAKEESIYEMVDSIKNVPVFRTFVDILTTFVSGYYVKGLFEFGPYYTFFSFNEIEGNRFRLGGRTSNKFSEKIMYDGHIAYGTKDTRLKYGLGLTYMFDVNPRESLRVYYKDDVEQLGKSQNAFLEDNILSSLLQRNPITKITRIKTFQSFYEKEWFQGFSNKVGFKHSTMFPTDSIPLFLSSDVFPKAEYSSITTSEFSLNTRLSWDEVYVFGSFERVSLGSDYPIINLDATLGVKNFLYSDYNYLKLGVNVQHLFNIGAYGWFKYTLDAGKIFGKLPYPLLRLHEGNETYAFDEWAFNMMNYYEFASDQYMSLYAEHHFMGLFLNRLPLLRKLEWREVVNTKILVGSLRDDNMEYDVKFPFGLTELSKPYVEAGIGIENIFKILRIDAMWRFSYLDHPNIETFGVRAMLYIAL
ncbi:MAG: DUF5686 and carboxypeptidase regulatory-like domain-containing protein [Bacteroidales bacterium]|nr:DUF5686 and carboxypeptidase regulatory-like domain-containing protein [Bacteroidales bacterium]MCF8454535.1 DUF5686 and carboxypeptidase regulatory-like domain-containing protein [Bacteroidales bacterium]